VQVTVDFAAGGFEAIPHATVGAVTNVASCPGAEDVSVVFIDGAGGDATFEPTPPPFNIVFFD
jgi:hypothetical protein